MQLHTLLQSLEIKEFLEIGRLLEMMTCIDHKNINCWYSEVQIKEINDIKKSIYGLNENEIIDVNEDLISEEARSADNLKLKIVDELKTNSNNEKYIIVNDEEVKTMINVLDLKYRLDSGDLYGLFSSLDNNDFISNVNIDELNELYRSLYNVSDLTHMGIYHNELSEYSKVAIEMKSNMEYFIGRRDKAYDLNTSEPRIRIEIIK